MATDTRPHPEPTPPKRANPFAGHPLSGLTTSPSGPLDQLLFQPASAAAVTMAGDAAPEKLKQNPNRSSKPVNQHAAYAANQQTGDGFDINAERDQRGTFELTAAEYDAISELKRPLGRQLGVRITLHDIVRCAVNQALDDYQTNGEASFLVRHLKHKRA